MKLKKLPNNLEGEIPKELKIIRRFYFEKMKNRIEKLETDVTEIQSKLQTA